MLNKIIIIGNVGTDPEMRFTPNGNPVTTFRVATTYTFVGSDGERRRETEWFDIVTWGKQAESCNQYLTKGQRVYVEGRLRTRTWEDAAGQKHFRLEINASRVIFLDRRGAARFRDLGAEVEEEETRLEDLSF